MENNICISLFVCFVFRIGYSNILLLGRDLKSETEVHSLGEERYKISLHLKFKQMYFSGCYLQYSALGTSRELESSILP